MPGLTITHNTDLTGLGTNAVKAGNNKNTAQGTCGNPPEYSGDPGNRTGTIYPYQPGVLTSFGAGRFQEKEGPGDRAVEGGPDNYTAIKLNNPVNRGQRLTRL
jgi:hypothetical protein